MSTFFVDSMTPCSFLRNVNFHHTDEKNTGPDCRIANAIAQTHIFSPRPLRARAGFVTIAEAGRPLSSNTSSGTLWHEAMSR